MGGRATRRSSLGRDALLSGAIAFFVAACGTRGPAVIGPLPDAQAVATTLAGSTQIPEPVRIDFSWALNEAGSRVNGIGVARIEPPYRARLDLFLDNGETVIAAALVDDELRLPPGAPDDVLPPVELMWATLGVFRPMVRASLLGGEQLEEGAERLRYQYADDMALRYEVRASEVRALEYLEGESVVQWVRLTSDGDSRYPASATYRNLVDFRELVIIRDSVAVVDPFDASIWDPRG